MIQIICTLPFFWWARVLLSRVHAVFQCIAPLWQPCVHDSPFNSGAVYHHHMCMLCAVLVVDGGGLARVVSWCLCKQYEEGAVQ